MNFNYIPCCSLSMTYCLSQKAQFTAPYLQNSCKPIASLKQNSATQNVGNSVIHGAEQYGFAWSTCSLLLLKEVKVRLLLCSLKNVLIHILKQVVKRDLVCNHNRNGG